MRLMADQVLSEIARRLLPNLPRRGPRAVAGERLANALSWV